MRFKLNEINTKTLNTTGGVDEQRLGTTVVYIFLNKNMIRFIKLVKSASLPAPLMVDVLKVC